MKKAKKVGAVPFAVPEWPGTRVEMRKVDALIANPHNSRKHPATQIEHLRASIREFGFTMPLLVDEKGMLLAGHARLQAAELDGIQEVPVIIARGWDSTKKRAYIEADNRLTDLGGWDEEARKRELEFLAAEGFDLESIGWNEKDLQKFIGGGTEGLTDPEETPEPAAKPIVRLGDVWQLGEHRIVCGDATSKQTWNRLMGGNRAAMVFTDPPYGVSYEAASGKFEVIEGDHKRRDDLFKMLVASLTNLCSVTNETAAFYIWHASGTRDEFTDAMRRVGLREVQYLIWVKPSFAPGWGHYRWAHEPCFYAAKDGQSPEFYGEWDQPTVWRVEVSDSIDIATTVGRGLLVVDGAGHSLYLQATAPKQKKVRQVRLDGKRATVHIADTENSTVWEVSRERNYQHPTQKPVELARRALENSSMAGEIVADGFAGSGTTIIAAEMTGRHCYAAELDPKYVQVCIDRWQKFTDRQATLDGVPFSEVAKGRANAKGNRRKSVRSRPRPARNRRPVAEQAVR